jgi:hypothetical protein
MRTAIIQIAAYNVVCPSCDEFIPSPHQSGSHLWVPDESNPTTMVCECGVEVRLPKKIRGESRS